MSKTEINLSTGDGCFVAICFILLLLCAVNSCDIQNDQKALDKKIDDLNRSIEVLKDKCK